jgi:hypothetical protein
MDSGASWVVSGTPNPPIAGVSLAAAPDDPEAIYALGGNGRFSGRSTAVRPGRHRRTRGLTGEYVQNLAVSPAAPGSL